MTPMLCPNMDRTTGATCSGTRSKHTFHTFFFQLKLLPPTNVFFFSTFAVIFFNRDSCPPRDGVKFRLPRHIFSLPPTWLAPVSSEASRGEGSAAVHTQGGATGGGGGGYHQAIRRQPLTL